MSTKAKTPILIVEDNLSDVKLTEFLLKQASNSFLPLTALSYFEATDILKNQEVEIALLDLNLPDIQGFKTLTKFLADFPNIPVIVLTSTNNEIIGNQAVRAGAQDFLVKGQFDSTFLGRSIRFSLQRWKTRNKLEESAHSLAISKHRAALAQDMARFGNWEMDLVTNEMYWSDEIFKILGLLPQSLTPSLSSYLEYVHIDDRKKVERFFDTFSKDHEQQLIHHRIIVNGQHLKTLELIGKVIYDKHTQKTLVVGCLLDLTNRQIDKGALSGIREIKRAQVHQKPITELSFNIRTLLTSIINYLFLIHPAEKSQEEYLQGLSASVEELWSGITNLLNRLVQSTDELSLEPKDFSFGKLLKIQDQLISFGNSNSKLDFKYKIDPRIPISLVGDDKKIQLVLSNLIDYIYRTSGSTNMYLEARLIDLRMGLADIQLKIHCGQSNREMCEKLISLFQHKDHQLVQDHDLGVGIAVRLIQLLEGSLTIDEDGTGGYFFRLRLPLQVKGDSNYTKQRPQTPLHILLVEDHPLNQLTTKKILQEWSEMVKVQIAADAEAGLEKFKQHSFDLILMDLQLPTMNGLEAGQMIREKSGVPLIALTARASVPERKQAYEIGFNDYLPKPVKPSDLYSKIVRVISVQPD